MSRRWVVMTTVVLLSLSAPGCMHGLMMGGHGGHEEPDQGSIRHEASSGPWRLSVEIPPMFQDSEGLIRFTVGGPPAVDAPRHVAWQVRESAESAHEEHTSMTTALDAARMEGIAKLEDGNGVAAFTPTAKGPYVLTALLAVEGDTLRAIATFAVRSSQGGGMMGMGSGWTTTIVVAAVMGGMMLAMWAVRGGL